MELVTTLNSQTVQNRVREVGINLNYWYPVGWANQLKRGEVTPVVIWQQAIAVYRDTAGQLHALEDVCPHRGVALHKGIVQGHNLTCPYHGWEFNGDGQCVNVPYLPSEQKLPCAKAISYPVQEKYDIIWVFPGDPAEALTRQPPDIPEFSQPGWLMIPVTANFKAHFSVCNENSMDIFHGFLHQNLQGWFDPALLSLRETETTVCAEYRVSYRGRMAKFLGLTEQANQVTTRTLSAQYRYPNFHSALPGISYLYLLRHPIDQTTSRSYTLFFLKVRLPEWVLKPLKPSLVKVIRRFVFLKFLNQDIEMIESEQQTYLANRQRRYVEINPAIIAAQRLTVRQYDQFMQKSSQLQTDRNGMSNILSEAMTSGQAEPTKENSIG